MDEHPAEAVEETNPPSAPAKSPRKRRTAPKGALQDASSTAQTDSSTEPAANAPATAGDGQAPEPAAEDKPARPKRTRKTKPAGPEAPVLADVGSVDNAGPGEAAPAAEGTEPDSDSKPRPTAPFAERRARTRRTTKAKPGEEAGESAEQPASGPAVPAGGDQPAASAGGGAAAAVTEQPAASTEVAPEEGAAPKTRSRRRRSRPTAAAAVAEPDTGATAPEIAAKSAEDAGAPTDEAAPPPSDADSDSEEPAQPGSGTSVARTRNRRRRSRSRGGGGVSAEPARGNGAEPAEGPSPASNGSAAAAATVPALVEPQAESRQPSTARSRKRRTSRRPRMEHIAPLGPRKMLVSTGERRSQIAVLEGRELIEHYVANHADESIVGNIYVGRVENVLPGMEAAFLDIGETRNAVLYVGEVSYEEEVEGPPPRIETLLKSGQAVLAQVTKDPMGTKGARLTTEVSLAGRYLVLVPNSDSLGISRRLSDAERRRLRDIANRIRPEGHGMIVRTAAVGASEEDLERDVARLTRIWSEVSERADGAKPPKLVYSEPPLAIRVVRDLFSSDVEEVIVDNEDSYHQIKDYLEEVAPDFGDRVQLYVDPMPLFERYQVMEQVRKAIDRKVWLQSGGHIVIDRTEAMTVIDVNTGRYVGRSTLEDTVLHANLEAAEEIAKQLRLRDIGGIIVIDFIDMGYERNRDELLRTFERALLRDKTRTQVYGVSELGLVQMTRKKVSEGLLEAFSNKCETCEGRGVILTDLA